MALKKEGLMKVEELFPFFPDFFPIVKMADAQGKHPPRNKSTAHEGELRSGGKAGENQRVNEW